MKKLAYILIVPMMIAASSVSKAQDYAEGMLGLPGDNLNLYAVMKLFQESETLEGFERALNDENNRINNLDLNGDNYIDYIRVIDQPDKDVHVIVLQVSINVRENQDVAVFIVQRDAGNQVRIQLIGDEALYGKDYIIEPNYNTDSRYAGETPNPGYTGRTTVVDGQTVVVNRVTTVEVAAWPLIRFMFLPTYVAWHSPWYWGYYPHYWHSWRPYYWHYYYGYHYNWYPHYYGYYHHHHHHNYPHYQSYYYGSKRAYSPYVVDNIHRGHYKTTYSRPDTRKEGSELYATTYGNRRTASGNTVSQQSGRSTVSQSSVKSTTKTDSRRAVSDSRSSGTTTYKSTGADNGRSSSGKGSNVSGTGTRRTSANQPAEYSTGRSSTQQAATKSTVKTDSRRTVSESRSTGAAEVKSTGSATGRSSAPQKSRETSVKKVSGESAAGSRSGSNTSTRRTSGNDQVKNTSKSSGSSTSGDQTRTPSATRR